MFCRQKITRLFVCVILIVLFPTLSFSAELDQQRQLFSKAYKTIQAGRDYDLEKLSEGLKDYPLYPYLQFAHLYQEIDTKPEKEISAFLKKYTDTPLADRLRTRWLYSLARRHEWEAFLKYYRSGGNVLRCYQLQARIKTGPVDKALLKDIKKMWLVGKSQVDECDPAFKVLYESRTLTPTLIWQRIRLAMQANNLRLAKHLARRLNRKDQARAKLWRDVYSDPEKKLLHPALKKDTPVNREIILYGLKRLAQRDSLKAWMLWNKLVDRHKFTLSEKRIMDRKIAFAAVQQDIPRAGKWLDQLQDQQQNKYVQHYLIRYAVANQEWDLLKKWTKKKVAEGFNELRWWYWRARSLELTGHQKEANHLFEGLSTKRDYYGFLSAENLGREYSFNHRSLPLNRKQKTQLLAIPGIQRAYELFKLEMYEEARREWFHATRKMEREQLLSAAVLAHEWGWHDRTILALGKAKAYDDLEKRFPLPFNSTIESYAIKRNLPTSIIYTLMRSESAFIHDVRSGAGAMGLMQLMPATAKHTAQKIGLKKYRNTRQLYEPKINIALGTAYLKELLDRYNGNLIMAAAAYNAGPHRVKRWRPEQGCMPGEFWVETIPFTETRRYVRRALFYSVLYQWRMGEKIDSIHSQLRPVPALNVSRCN